MGENGSTSTDQDASVATYRQTSGQLAAPLHVTPGAVTQIVAQLSEHDLVEQYSSGQDGRV